MSAATVVWEPRWLSGPAGRLFTLHLTSNARCDHPRGVVFCPPFAEEMNKSRRTVRLAAAALAAAGHEVLIVDVHGTGDSDGDFGDGDWSLWCEELAFAARWLADRGLSQTVYWGLRTGAALALEAAAGGGGERCLLWQPVVDGGLYLRQFLRMRVAADLLFGGDAGAGAEALREALAGGEAVEVGGYCLTPGVAASLAAIDLVTRHLTTRTHWVEVVSAPERPLPVATRRAIDARAAAGSPSELAREVAPNFWSSPEVVVAQALVAHAGELGRRWAREAPAAGLVAGATAASEMAGATVATETAGATVATETAGATDATAPRTAPDTIAREAGGGPVAAPLRALRIACGDAYLAGILHLPATDEGGPATRIRRGVVIVVGGPQTRVGSHRQFVHLARDLAAAGVPALRFDLRGMGDSDGESAGFEALQPELTAAVDALLAACPALQEVVLWGLCDAASAIMMDAWRDPRVRGVALANPWVRTTDTQARTLVRHYYAGRLLSGDFWRRMLGGQVDLRRAVASFRENLARTLRREGRASAAPGDAPQPFPERMRDGMGRFRGDVLLLLSGNDLTAREFLDATADSRAWRGLLTGDRWTRQELADATHTFSRADWRDQVSRWTRDWLLRQRE